MSGTFSLLNLAEHLMRVTFSNKSYVIPCATVRALKIVLNVAFYLQNRFIGNSLLSAKKIAI